MSGHGDRLTVQDENGEEVEVFNHASVVQRHYVNSVNGYESFEPIVSEGDTGRGRTPEAVTKRLSDLLYDEFGIDVEDIGVRVIDPGSEEVDVL